MNRAHIGIASSAAYPARRIGFGVSKPIQTPAASDGVKPTNHASR